DPKHFYPDPDMIIELDIVLIEFLADIKLFPYKYDLQFNNQRDWLRWISPDGIIVKLEYDYVSGRSKDWQVKDATKDEQRISLQQLEKDILLIQFKAWHKLMQEEYKKEIHDLPIGLKVPE